MLSGLFELSPEPCWSGIYLVWLSTKRKRIKKKKKEKASGKHRCRWSDGRRKTQGREGRGMTRRTTWTGTNPVHVPVRSFTLMVLELAWFSSLTQTPPMQFFQKISKIIIIIMLILVFCFPPCTLPVITPMFPSVSFPASRLRWSLVTDSSVSRRAN